MFNSINLKNIEWGSTSIFIIFLHLIVLIGLPIYFFYRTPSLGLILAAIALFFATGISITAGYHRLYSHRSYKASKAFEAILLFFSTMAMQSSVIYWAHNHRLHHRYVDKEGDPHNINEGFWHAHIGWLFKKQIPEDETIIPDLVSNNLVMFQHKYFKFLTFANNILFFLLLGWLFSDYWGAFIIGWCARVLLLSHSTWFVNSLAHTWGAKTYSKEQTAVNNAIVALLTFGEGYHNYHHVFSSDYRNGIRWFQYDPTKWLIWALSKIRLVSELKKIDIYTSKNRIVMEDRFIFLEALKTSTYEKKQALQQKVIEISDNISKKIADVKKAINEYKLSKENKIREDISTLRWKIKELNAGIRNDWKSWRQLEKEVSAHAVLHHYHN